MELQSSCSISSHSICVSSMTMSIIDLDVHVVQAYSIVSMYTEKKSVLPPYQFAASVCV